MSLLRTVASTGAIVPKLDASDVFSTYLYTPNGSTQTINNGIDLAGKGGMVWVKARSTTYAHVLTDTLRGLGQQLSSNNTVGNNYEATAVNAWNSNGFSMGDKTDVNASGVLFSSWTFREAPKFFHQVQKVHTNGTASTVDLSTLGTVGMVTVKSTVNSGNWFTWHKDLTAGNNLKLNLTDAQSTTNAYLSVSGTTLTIASTAPSDTYIVYSWAHDTSADGIIQCGSFTTTSGGQFINIGWEIQYILVKARNSATNWYIFDVMRGIPVGTADYHLKANLSNAEGTDTIDYISPYALGFHEGFDAAVGTGIEMMYMAIRRPNKVPTSGTQVYNAIARTGTSAVATVAGVGFAPDLVITKDRISGLNGNPTVFDKLRGNGKQLGTPVTSAETSYPATQVSFDMTGVTFGADTYGISNASGFTYINHFFKRAKEFLDEVCDTGTGSAHTIAHNLSKAPELWLRKGRSGATQWVWGSSLLANTEKVNMPTTAGKATDANAWNSTYPTSTVFTVGTSADVNTNGATYVTYLWGSVVGVSKIGTFTGNGSSQTINCGFSTGARFVLIFRTSAAGEFYIWDTVRGIVAGNDPHLSLNTTAAEVTTDDTIDPEASGFIVNQVAATNVNVTSATYIYLAIA